MEQRQLGRSSITISKLGLGTLALGNDGAPTAERVRTVHRALEAGVTLLVTGPDAPFGDAPELVGRALSDGRRDDVVLALSVTEAIGPAGPRGSESARSIVAAVEDGLRRLGTDWIDLCLLHRPWLGDIDEALGALSDLVRSGEVLQIGTSGVPLTTLVEAQWVAQQRFFKRFVAAELAYSLVEREAERELLPTCQRYRMSALVSRPLGGGWLWGDLRRGDEALPRRFDLARVENQRRLRRMEGASRLAAEAGLPLAQLALAFVLRRPGVAAAIVGPRTLEQLEGLLPAADVELDDETLRRIDEIAPPS